MLGFGGSIDLDNTFITGSIGDSPCVGRGCTKGKVGIAIGQTGNSLGPSEVTGTFFDVHLIGLGHIALGICHCHRETKFTSCSRGSRNDSGIGKAQSFRCQRTIGCPTGRSLSGRNLEAVRGIHIGNHLIGTDGHSLNLITFEHPVVETGIINMGFTNASRSNRSIRGSIIPDTKTEYITIGGCNRT